MGRSSRQGQLRPRRGRGEPIPRPGRGTGEGARIWRGAGLVSGSAPIIASGISGAWNPRPPGWPGGPPLSNGPPEGDPGNHGQTRQTHTGGLGARTLKTGE